LLFAPLAIANGVLAPFVGMIIDRFPPLPVLGFGFSMLAIGLTWLSFEMAPGTPIWRLVLAFGAIGVGMAFVWSPLTATATRNLPPRLAGASSGVYNTTRQLGAVLGSSGMAAFMTSRLSAEMPYGGHGPAGAGALRMPAFLREPFSAAMSQSLLLPAFIALFGIIAALFLVGFTGSERTREGGLPEPTPEDDGGYDDYDDDDYVEYILRRDADIRETAGHPVDSLPHEDSIGFAHNGFQIDNGQRFPSVAQFSRPAFEATRHGERSAMRQIGADGAHARPAGQPSPTPYRLNAGESQRNKHDGADPQNPISGRHSS
jgi:hypothetical protein